MLSLKVIMASRIGLNVNSTRMGFGGIQANKGTKNYKLGTKD